VEQDESVGTAEERIVSVRTVAFGDVHGYLRTDNASFSQGVL